ncbi:hypothetical protein PAEPH01_1946 [Pancytospora epiphaga]|nr:hypothetical protein PAEPH01_1946 [Pancytospora epiphaga]
MIRNIWSVDNLIYYLVRTRTDIFNKISGFNCNILDINDTKRVFRGKYVHHAIENFEQNDNIFEITDIEMKIFRVIFNLRTYHIILKFDGNIKIKERLEVLENTYAVNKNSLKPLHSNINSKLKAADGYEHAHRNNIFIFKIGNYFIPILKESKTK